jgi:hypothetical protein
LLANRCEQGLSEGGLLAGRSEGYGPKPGAS